MKTLLVIVSLIATYGYAQRTNSRFTPPTGSCECAQIRTLTGQDHVSGGERDGTQSVCLFRAFGFNGQVSFEGGWHLTGDLVRYECNGGIAGTGRVTYGSEPSPLCKVVSVRQEVARSGLCVHQADLDRNNRISAEERAAWDQKNAPITEGPEGYVGKASQMAIDYWNSTFGFALSGSNLCDKALKHSDPAAYQQCVETPFECRRLNFVKAVNPIMSEQIKAAFSGYNNNLDHCE